MTLLVLAVHISDGVLQWPWYIGAIAIAFVLVLASSFRISDEEIPRVGILTAAFFVASSIRVPFGPASVHLLLNGLVGILLGPRAALAIAVGLILQTVLLEHGGKIALGINVLIISVPALLARPLFLRLVQSSHDSRSIGREALLAVTYILHPLLMLPILILTLVGIRCGWRDRVSVDFRAGFLVGSFTVLLTAALNAAILMIAGVEDWRVVAVIVFAAHIPIAIIEGVIVGFAVGFLRRVKPELLL